MSFALLSSELGALNKTVYQLQHPLEGNRLLPGKSGGGVRPTSEKPYPI